MRSTTFLTLFFSGLLGAALPAADGADGVVTWDEEHQEIQGFGACDAWFCEHIVVHPRFEELMDLAFSRERGAGLSILRHRVTPKAEDWDDYEVDLDSGDLDIGRHPLVGLRFVGLAVPQGARVVEARIQFTADGTSESPSPATISAEAADSAVPITAAQAALSSRPTTAASVEWDIPAWRENRRSESERTPDIATVIQEVVARPGWASGNDLLVLIRGEQRGRSAFTFDSDPEQVAVLHLRLDDGSAIEAAIGASADDAEEEGVDNLTASALVTQAAFERDCVYTWSAAWSPPYEWKRDAHPEDPQRNGFLMREHYQDYADYLERYRQEFEARSGIALYAISPQNEPGRKPWESCEWRPEDYRDFIRDFLHPTLDESCHIVAPETTRAHQLRPFYNVIYADPEAHAAVDILGFHCYPKVTDEPFTDYGRPVWETEYSYDTSGEDLSIENGVEWAYNWWRMLANADVSAVHHWWLVNFKHGQQALINADKVDDAIEVPKRLWTMGNYSRFLRPGWVRIGVTKQPLGEDVPVYLVAGKDPASGDFAIVAINRSEAAQAFALDFAGFTAAELVPYRTSAEEDLAELLPVPAGTGATVELAPMSVTTFVGTAAGD